VVAFRADTPVTALARHVVKQRARDGVDGDEGALALHAERQGQSHPGVPASRGEAGGSMSGGRSAIPRAPNAEIRRFPAAEALWQASSPETDVAAREAFAPARREAV
jgi:hypothetical protein